MIEALPLEAKDVFDIALVWALIWAGIAWLRTTSARLAIAGLAILGAVYLVARQLGLELLTWILQGFFAVFVIVAIVVFQEELRRLFEQIATLGRLGRGADRVGPDSIDTLVRTLGSLAQQRWGALIVLPGRESLERHLDGGIALDAKVSEPLLLSLFDPSSPGHDGAIVIDGDRVRCFAAHLPLSSNHTELGQRGTRHAAGLGLCERTDALCVVVSEERGTVSLARDGRLDTLPSPQSASEKIRGFVGALSPRAAERSRMGSGVLRRWREALVALPLAATLWFVVVPGSGQAEVERDVAIQVTGLPKGFQLESVEPATATVRLGGRRRDLLLLEPEAVEVRVDAILVELGRRSFELSPDNVMRPEGISVLEVDPAAVKVSLRRTADPAAARPGP